MVTKGEESQERDQGRWGLAGGEGGGKTSTRYGAQGGHGGKEGAEGGRLWLSAVEVFNFLS